MNRRGMFLIVAMVASLTVSAFAEAGAFLATGGGQFSVPVKSMQAMRFQSVVHQQYDFSCGSAAVATLLTYNYDDPTDEGKVFKWMWDHGNKPVIQKKGFSLFDMKSYLVAHGFEANGYHVPLSTLAEKDIPAIALIDFNGYMHFVVIKGVTQQDVLVGDPALGLRIIPRERFDAMWKNNNGILFVITDGKGLKHAEATFNSVAAWRQVPTAPLRTIIQQQPSLDSFLFLVRPAGSF